LLGSDVLGSVENYDANNDDAYEEPYDGSSDIPAYRWLSDIAVLHVRKARHMRYLKNVVFGMERKVTGGWQTLGFSSHRTFTGLMFVS